MMNSSKKQGSPSVEPISNAKGIVFVHGDKGGVGKSFTCARLIDALATRNVPVAAVDGDTQNPDVARMFEGIIPVKSCNLRSADGWMDLLDFIVEHNDKTVVLSLPAGIGSQIKDQGIQFCDNMRLLKRPVHLVWVLNRLPDSINLLAEALTTVGPYLESKTAVKNLVFGDASKFGRWNESSTKRNFEADGGKTIDLLELNERVVDKLFGDANNVLPFSKCVSDISDVGRSTHSLTPSENLALIQWLKKTELSFKEVFSQIGVLE